MNYLDIELKGIDEKGIEKTYKLSDFKGENLIIYFYPQDDTPVCTQEAQEFRDKKNALEKYARIIGVSQNDINDHIDFHNNHNLDFILLSDSENKLKEAFEKQNKHIFNLHRATFILNKQGNIVKYWDKVDVENHINEILDYLNKE